MSFVEAGGSISMGRAGGVAWRGGVACARDASGGEEVAAGWGT